MFHASRNLKTNQVEVKLTCSNFRANIVADLEGVGRGVGGGRFS